MNVGIMACGSLSMLYQRMIVQLCLILDYNESGGLGLLSKSQSNCSM